jgi:hypothetical protein
MRSTEEKGRFHSASSETCGDFFSPEVENNPNAVLILAYESFEEKVENEREKPIGFGSSHEAYFGEESWASNETVRAI